MPVLPSLDTTILGGLLNLGESTLTFFADAGVVWDVQIPSGRSTEKRLGTGMEIKNQVGIGPLKFVHSLGIAQPAGDLFSDRDYDLYYQIKASVPF
jgi:outer membrane protein assembly factor BamA